MSKFRQIVQGLPVYLKAGPLGRRYLRDLWKSSRDGGGAPTPDFLRRRWQRSLLMRNFSICDRCFRSWIPAGIQSSSGTDRSRIYLRMIPFAWVGQAIRTRMLAAFDLAYDRAAEERSVLQSFVHREWNDLADRCGVAVEDLYSAAAPQGPPRPEMALLRSIWQRFFQMVPRGDFPNYYRLVDESPRIFSRRATLENAARITAENGLFAARQSLYIMRDILPDSLEKILPAFGMWLYCLDEFSDIDRDIRAGRTTFMSTAENPEQELQRVYIEMQNRITAAAPHPRRLLDYLDILQNDVLRLKGRGIDIESRLLHAD